MKVADIIIDRCESDLCDLYDALEPAGVTQADIENARNREPRSIAARFAIAWALRERGYQHHHIARAWGCTAKAVEYRAGAMTLFLKGTRRMSAFQGHAHRICADLITTMNKGVD